MVKKNASSSPNHIENYMVAGDGWICKIDAKSFEITTIPLVGKVCKGIAENILGKNKTDPLPLPATRTWQTFRYKMLKFTYFTDQGSKVHVMVVLHYFESPSYLINILVIKIIVRFFNVIQDLGVLVANIFGFLFHLVFFTLSIHSAGFLWEVLIAIILPKILQHIISYLIPSEACYVTPHYIVLPNFCLNM